MLRTWDTLGFKRKVHSVQQSRFATEFDFTRQIHLREKIVLIYRKSRVFICIHIQKLQHVKTDCFLRSDTADSIDQQPSNNSLF